MIPIMRPLLPGADSLLPYLKRIDIARWYSNFGPLALEYEERLAAMFNCHVVSCASGTVGLTAALMAVLPFNHKTRAMVAMPSWTFAATASAVFAAGYRPLICDVDASNVLEVWGCGGAVGFVPVMPLGAPINLEWWEDFGKEFNVGIVIDGAAGFDALSRQKIGNCPVVVSTHATKVFGTGEGGFVLSVDAELIAKIRKIINQGMNVDKSVSMLGFNGKLSEYHAALGLAELDGWKEKRAKWKKVQEWYGKKQDYVNSTHDEIVKEGVDTEHLIKKMSESGVQCRTSWYGIAHKQKVFMQCFSQDMGHDGTIRMRMDRTEMLARRTLFLPKYVDMRCSEVDHVRETLEECLNAR